MYRHTSQPYDAGSTTKNNFNRFYGTVYDSELEFSANIEPAKIKTPIDINVESNQAWSIPLMVNYRPESEGGSQITELETTDFELFEGQYWSNFLRDKYTPSAVAGAYPLLDGDELRAAFHKIRLATSIEDGTASDAAELPKIFSATVNQLYIPIS